MRTDHHLARLFFLRAVLALCLITASSPLTAVEPVKPLRVLQVTGGCCHDYEQQKKILADGISERINVEFTTVHEGKDRKDKVSIYEKADWAQGYDLVLHNECYGAIEDVPYVERIAKPHFDGIPAVMLHCSTHSYRAAKTDEWRKAVGQSSFSHEKNRDLKIDVVGDHPIMKGFPNGWHDPADELYKNEKLWPNLVPLATSFGMDTQKDHVVIWTNTYGKGKVFGTTLGHSNATMSDPIYLDLVSRGLLWACDKLDADGKPVAGYGPQTSK